MKQWNHRIEQSKKDGCIEITCYLMSLFCAFSAVNSLKKKKKKKLQCINSITWSSEHNLCMKILCLVIHNYSEILILKYVLPFIYLLILNHHFLVVMNL